MIRNIICDQFDFELSQILFYKHKQHLHAKVQGSFLSYSKEVPFRKCDGLWKPPSPNLRIKFWYSKEIWQKMVYIFFIRTPRCDCSYVLDLVNIYVVFKWLSLSIFHWTQSNLNLWWMVNMVKFNEFLCATIFEKFQMWAKWMRLEGIFSLRFLIWNICKQSTVHLQLSPNL